MKIKEISLLAGGIVIGILLVGSALKLASFRQQPEARSPSYTASSHHADPKASLNLALIGAVKKRDTAQVKVLLARGADPNTRDQSALKDWKTRMAGIVTEQDPATGKLREHPRGEGAQPFLGPTVLMIAAHLSDNATLRTLAGAGAVLNARGVDYGAAQAAAADFSVDLDNHVTPLMEAMLAGDASTMRLLIQKGANINMLDSKGATALDWANNMTPTTQTTPGEQKVLDNIFSVLTQAKAKRGQDVQPK